MLKDYDKLPTDVTKYYRKTSEMTVKPSILFRDMCSSLAKVNENGKATLETKANAWQVVKKRLPPVLKPVIRQLLKQKKFPDEEDFKDIDEMYNEHAAEAGTLHLHALEIEQKPVKPNFSRSDSGNRSNSGYRNNNRDDNHSQNFQKTENSQKRPNSNFNPRNNNTNNGRQSRRTEQNANVKHLSAKLPLPRIPKKPDDPRPASKDKYGAPVCPAFGKFQANTKFCWYHKWYGASANYCVPPCIWDPNYARRRWGNQNQGNFNNNNNRPGQQQQQQQRPMLDNQAQPSTSSHLNS